MTVIILNSTTNKYEYKYIKRLKTCYSDLIDLKTTALMRNMSCQNPGLHCTLLTEMNCHDHFMIHIS